MYLVPHLISEHRIHPPIGDVGHNYMAITPVINDWYLARQTTRIDTGSIVACQLKPFGDDFRMVNMFDVLTPELDPFDDQGRKVDNYEDQTPFLPNRLFKGSKLCMVTSQVTRKASQEGLRCSIAKTDLNPNLTRGSATRTMGSPEQLSEQFLLPEGSFLKELECLKLINGEPWHIAEGDDNGHSCLCIVKMSENGITDAKMLLTAPQVGAEHLSTGSHAISLGQDDLYLVFINRRINAVWSGTYLILKINKSGVTVEYIPEHNIIEAKCGSGEGPQGQTVAFISAAFQLKGGELELYYHLNDMYSIIVRMMLVRKYRQF